MSGLKRPSRAARTSPWRTWTRRVETRLLSTLVAVSVAVAGFVALTSEVREGDTGWFDKVVLLAFRQPGHLDQAIGPRWVQESARDITALGGVTVLTLVSILAITLLLIHRRRLQAVVFASTVIIAQISSEMLKLLFGRPRPGLVSHLDLVYSSSYPSGHAMMTPAVYLTLAAIIAAGERGRGEKVLLVVCAALMVASVGVSRVYLGVHWPTDVLAGWILGAAIALAGAFVLNWIARAPSPETPIPPHDAR